MRADARSRSTTRIAEEPITPRGVPPLAGQEALGLVEPHYREVAASSRCGSTTSKGAPRRRSSKAFRWPRWRVPKFLNRQSTLSSKKDPWGRGRFRLHRRRRRSDDQRDRGVLFMLPG